MLFLRTGLPGASKTLNTIKEICEDKNNAGRQVYYNNIKVMLLDIDICSSFAGWFYGRYLHSLDDAKLKPVQKILTRIHEEGELASVDSFPHLAQYFESWLAFKGDVKLWVEWARKCYPKTTLEPLELYLSSTEEEHRTTEHLKQFKLHWQHFSDPKLWYELPRGEIIVIDECQQWFPPRPTGSRVPQHCAEFETHRHKGWDVHLITQSPKFLDYHIRGLAGRHIHYFNPWGSNRVSRLQGDKAFDPEDYFAKKAAQQTLIKRDKKYYGLYWSADKHTHKLALPKKLLVVLPLPFIVIWAVYYMISGHFLSSEPPKSQPLNSSAQPVQQASNTATAVQQTNFQPFSKLAETTPIGQLCTALTYAGFELKKYGPDDYSVIHFFSCELPYTDEPEQNQSEDTPPPVKPSLLLDGAYMQTLGYVFNYKNNLPVLTYGDNTYVFPRY